MLIKKEVRLGAIRKVLKHVSIETRWRIHRLKARHNILRIRTKNGYSMDVLADDPGLSKQLIINRKREVLATDFFMEHLDEGSTVLEPGANIGYYTLLCLEKGCKVICLEPNPLNFPLLKQNVMKSGKAERAKLYELAASDKKGTEMFTLFNLSNAGAMSALDKTGIKRTNVAVKTERLDNLINERIDYLRMDVEGYESTIIKGMQGIFSSDKKPKKLFIEVHPIEMANDGTSLGEFMEKLFSYGYMMKVAFYEGSGLLEPISSHRFDSYGEFRDNPDFEKRSAQVFFELSPKKGTAEK